MESTTVSKTKKKTKKDKPTNYMGLGVIGLNKYVKMHSEFFKNDPLYDRSKYGEEEFKAFVLARIKECLDLAIECRRTDVEKSAHYYMTAIYLMLIWDDEDYQKYPFVFDVPTYEESRIYNGLATEIPEEDRYAQLFNRFSWKNLSCEARTMHVYGVYPFTAFYGMIYREDGLGGIKLGI